VAIDRRDDVQSNTPPDFIKRAVGSKSETAAYPQTGVAYERRSGRAEVDGVQQAAATKCIRGDSVEHASARLEAQVADTERRPVVVDHAYGGDQAAGIRIDLDKRAGVATRYS
jgi:hypothetical protein